MSEALPYPTDYLETLQTAAMGFMERRQGEHLSEQELFTRTVNYLVDTMSCNRAVAENMVTRAYGEIKATDTRFLDVSNSTANVAMLVDPRSGLSFAVPVGLIFQVMIDSPLRRRLHEVKAKTEPTQY